LSNLIALFLAAFFNSASASKRFIFRQDDIEDYYHNTVQASMINWFIDNGVGISVGIISDSFTGQDPVIYNALKRCVAQGMDKCTIWNHGTDAAYHYGEAASVAEAQQKVQACDTKIRTVFPGYQPFLMVPHENSWGPYLLQALRNIGYKVISASIEDYSGMTWDLTLNPMQMPQQATTGDWSDAKAAFVGVPVSKTVADCEAAAARGEVCVIMTHPHEFANGAYSLTTLAQLVQSLKAAGFTSTNFYTVMNEQLGVNSAPTLLPTKAPTPAPAPTRVPTVAATAVPSISMAPTSKIISTDGKCGASNGNTFCGGATEPCCSQYGWCGAATAHCGTGCQSAYGICNGPTVAPTNKPVVSSTAAPTNQPVVPSTAAPTNQPVVSSTSAPTNQPVVPSTAAPTNQPVVPSTAAPTNQPVVSSTAAPTNQPVVSSTAAPSNQPVVSSTAPTNSPVTATPVPTNAPVVATAVPTKSPVTGTISTDGKCGPSNGNTFCGAATEPCCSQYGWCGAATAHCGLGCQSAYGICKGPTYSPSAQPVTASPTAPVTQLQYTAIIRVKSSSTYQYQWLNVLETIRNVEKNQNLLDVQYSGNTAVLSTATFDISVKMTFGLTAGSNPQSVYDTTAQLLTQAISQKTFNTYYYSLGADKKTTFTRVTYQGDATLNHEINDKESADSNSNKHGLFSFHMSGANISILAGICFFMLLCFVVIGYFLYQRCYSKDSDAERKRVYSISTTGSNEEMLSPAEQFVEIELNGHYSLPLSDNSDFVEDACIRRHGLKLPGELENV
jgi:hypothetical protein